MEEKFKKVNNLFGIIYCTKSMRLSLYFNKKTGKDLKIIAKTISSLCIDHIFTLQ